MASYDVAKTSNTRNVQYWRALVKTARALQTNNGDIGNAIMDLTM